MAEIRLTRVEQGHTKIRNVPIAVTPEGFWCCPSPTAFQKSLKSQNSINKSKSSPPEPQSQPKTTTQKKQATSAEKKPSSVPLRTAIANSDDTPVANNVPPPAPERVPRPKVEGLPRKVAIEFGEPGSSDVKVVLFGKQGFCVKLSVHKNVLAMNSSFFAEKFSDREAEFSCLEIDECEDVEIYVETVGLMYCKDMKQRLIKQSVSRVLRILKVGELLGFGSCIKSCLEFLEAVPWVGEEEEQKVVSSVQQLQVDGIRVTPVLKRVSSEVCNPPKDTLSHILELVLKSNDERGRREMKSIVLKLLKENNTPPNYSTGTADICSEIIHTSCESCLDSLLAVFRQAAELDFTDKILDSKEPIMKQLSQEADNILWLLEILAERQAADKFAVIWSNQQELTSLHNKLPTVSRYHVNFVTARLFVGIGRGELLPSKDTRQLLLQTWLQPLINDYNWLQHGCRSFDRKLVEEGIGRTILTLPLEDQQGIMLSWMGNFLKAGDRCPNLNQAFEVWWRRTFVRPYVDVQSHPLESDNLMTLK
ncbi:hypothetical protein ACFE04_001415 [Oxalis oulophora]